MVAAIIARALVMGQPLCQVLSSNRPGSLSPSLQGKGMRHAQVKEPAQATWPVGGWHLNPGSPAPEPRC